MFSVMCLSHMVDGEFKKLEEGLNDEENNVNKNEECEYDEEMELLAN